MYLVFVVVSFISVTLAWFAYSGISSVKTDIDVKAWYIELEKDGEPISNDISVTVPEIYPGMEPYSETISIKNLGDSNAQVKYNIVSVRILDNARDSYTIDNINVISQSVEDIISHDYPFHVNMNVSKHYIEAHTGESEFTISVTWPLDSGNDLFDSQWGEKAYRFQTNVNNANLPAIQVVVSVTAEQDLHENATSDSRFLLGTSVGYNLISNEACELETENCTELIVIDENNLKSNEDVTFIPVASSFDNDGVFVDYTGSLEIYSQTNSWDELITLRPLVLNDILPVISKDVIGSVMVRSTLSDTLIGSLNAQERLNTQVSKITSSRGYFQYTLMRFNYLSSSNCVWINNEIDTNTAFAFKNYPNGLGRIYFEDKLTACKIIPVISISKQKFL